METFAVALALAVLSGCPSAGGGGGGGGGDATDNSNDNVTDGNTNDNVGDNNANENAGDGGQNTSPIAEAGELQTVSGGVRVQLDGSGSSDPDGDALTYSWTQTGGTQVTLQDADTVSPSFTAPGTTDTLTFEVTTDDGNGGRSTDTVVVNVVVEPSTLFVVNNITRITSYANAGAVQGEVAATTSLPVGSTTGVFQPRAIVVTPDGDLIISSQNDAIVVYNDAFAATGATRADRVIEGNNTLLDLPISFAYDPANDSLYVGNGAAGDGVLVFENVSSEEFDGDVAPARRFGPGDRVPFGNNTSTMPSYEALAFDTLGNLYAADQSGSHVNFSRILVYANPETAENLAEPVRTITGKAVGSVRPWGQIEDIAIDSNNTMYIVDSEERVVVLDNVDMLDGEVEPSATITLQVNLADLQGVVVGSDGIGYLADHGNHAIHVLDNIATLDGDVAPDRTIEGFDTELRTPRDMFLFEPGSQ